MQHKKIRFTVNPSQRIQGTIRVPGDKSISHRSIMLGSLAEGTTYVSGFLDGDDCLATLNAFRAMGIEIEGPEAGRVVIHGKGLHGLSAPQSDLYMGNSGTSIRLMSGLMSGQAFPVRMTGDRSLSKRPMKRVTVPLSNMGAIIETSEQGTPPIQLAGNTAEHQLTGIHYDLPMASAQVKSCVLLAGLYAAGETSVTEPAPTRDHTERMLRGFGYEVITEGKHIRLQGGGKLIATKIDVPADISSAAFFMVAASIAKDADLTLEHVGINPTRTGVIDILRLMGANIELMNQREVGGEPVADIRIRSAALKGIDIPENLVPLAIDEFPVLFIAASVAEGRTVLTGAKELRVKESDRIQVMADGLQACGVDAQPTEDGIIIQGGGFTGGTIDSHDDHRIAMSFTVASLIAKSPITINDCATVKTSFPNFVELASRVGIDIEASEYDSEHE
jgi:3-phosphoshikimate 1-carboxyvinyltransferase